MQACSSKALKRAGDEGAATLVKVAATEAAHVVADEPSPEALDVRL